jgi:hypothetical protein
MNTRLVRFALPAILVAALAFRLATAAFLGFNAPPDRAACGADTVEFEHGAWSMAQGQGYVLWEGGAPSAFRAPGYPLMLAGIYRMAGRRFWVNRVALSVIGTLTCLVVYKLALALGLTCRVALCAVLVVALHPLQAYFCGHFMSEVPSAFLNVLATLMLVMGMGKTESGKQKAEIRNGEGDSRGGAESAEGALGKAECGKLRAEMGMGAAEMGSAVGARSEGGSRVAKGPISAFRFQLSAFTLAGLLNGLSILVRPAAIFLAPVLGGLLLLTYWRRPVRAMVLAGLFGLGTLVAVAPWTYRNYRVFDRFCLVADNGGSTLWGANNAVVAAVGGKHWGSWISTGFDMETKQREVLVLPNEVDRDRREWQLGVQYLREHPGKIPALLAGKLYQLVTPFPRSPNRTFVALAAVSQIVMVTLYAMGLAALGHTVLNRVHLPALAQLLTLFATVVVFYGSERFRVPYEPIFAVYAGAGLAWGLGGWGRGRREGRRDLNRRWQRERRGKRGVGKEES